MPEGPRYSTADRKALEKTVLWKMDTRILPIVTLIYLVNALDRINIGNASIAGLITDLHLKGTQFNTALAVFFIPYILSEVPSNAVLKRFKANRWLASLIAAWSLVTVVTGFTRNYVGLTVVRLMLGLCEGGVAPGIVLYMSYMYRRHELQIRLGVFSCSSTFAGLIGGLLASGILKMNGVLKLAGWRWIFIIEGVATSIVAIVTYFLLPLNATSASFLTEEEREYVAWRLSQDKDLNNGVPLSSAVERQGNYQGKGDIITSDFVRPENDSEEEEKFEWREIRRGIFGIQTWLCGLALTGLGVNLYSFLFFFPLIITGLGYTGIQAQLHTTLPYLLATFLIITVSLLSDRLQLRGPFALVFTPLAMIGYIIAITGKTNMARYAGCCFIAAGAYTAAPCLLALVSNNASGHYKRSSAVAMQIGIANTSGFIATFIYTPDQAPKYIRGHTISLGFAIFTWVLIAANVLYCIWENKARREGRRQGNIEKYMALRNAGLTKAPIGDRDPGFVFTL